MRTDSSLNYEPSAAVEGTPELRSTFCALSLANDLVCELSHLQEVISKSEGSVPDDLQDVHPFYLSLCCFVSEKGVWDLHFCWQAFNESSV